MKSSGSITFHFENTKHFPFHHFRLREWINYIITKENKSVGTISIIFCDDDTLLRYNKDFLNSDYFTDVITFDYTNYFQTISGDIFISVDMVRENARIHEVGGHYELYRVIFHGILHLLGYADDNELKAKIMREREDYYLEYFNIDQNK